MSRKKAEKRWSSDDFVERLRPVRVSAGAILVNLEDLRKAIAEAYGLGHVHGVEDGKNPSPQYSTQKQYSDRYAKLRDLGAYGLEGVPIKLDPKTGVIKVLQGDLLDQFLDQKIL